MATINESPVLKNILKGDAFGILTPHLSNRFVVRFDVTPARATFSQDCFDLLSMQLIKAKLDLKNSTISLILEQPLHNYEFFLVLVKELVGMYDVDIKILTSPSKIDEEPVALLTLERCKLMDHDFELDYAALGSAKHHLTFKFDFSSVRNRIICEIHDLEKARAASSEPLTTPTSEVQ